MHTRAGSFAATARLRATFNYSVRDLLVHPSLLGTSRELAIGDYLIRIVLPVETATREDEPQPSEEELDALFPPREPSPDLPGAGRATTTVSLLPSDDIASVRVVRVEAHFDGRVAADDFVDHDQPKESPAFDPAYEDLHAAQIAARDGLQRTLAWIRVTGRQHWLGLSTEAPEGVGQALLVDADAGNRLPLTMGASVTVIQHIRKEQVLNADLLDWAVGLAQQAQEPSLADSLLADAIYMAQAAEPTDTPRALLIAAIACELKIKTTLRERAAPAQHELIDVLLTNPRDWSLSAVAHFDRPLKAVAGVSLKESDRELWKDVTGLFERRNKLAHRGEIPSDDEALDSIKAAARAFTWLTTNIPPQPT